MSIPTHDGMSTHPIAKLLQLWRQGNLTTEQVSGHILQHLELLEQQLQALKKEVRALQQALKLT